MSQLEFTEKELEAIRATFCPGFTDQQFEVCMTFCRVRNLLPGKHVLFQLRSSKEWDEAAQAKVPVTKIIFITTIDASRLIAQRTGQYGGQAPEQYIYLDSDGSPSLVSEIPLPKLPLPEKGITALPREPWAVRTTVFRKDFSQPISSIARFDAYAAVYNTANGPRLTEMWSRRGPEQLAKCSEMLSLRKAFPEELGGIFIQEEFKPDQDEAPSQPVTPTVAVPFPPVVPKVNQAPAVPTNTPRPGEDLVKSIRKSEPSPNFPDTPPSDSVHVSQPSDPKEAILASVPGLKPASEISVPAKKRRGPKPKTQPSPDNGRNVESEGGITDADIANAGTPPPEFDEEASRREAKEFVDSISSFTKTEAEAQGLPDPGQEAIPESKQKNEFIVRMRALVEPGVDIRSLGDYTLSLGNKTSSKLLTIGDWTRAFANLDAAKAEGKLKELIKNAPQPKF